MSDERRLVPNSNKLPVLFFRALEKIKKILPFLSPEAKATLDKGTSMDVMINGESMLDILHEDFAGIEIINGSKEVEHNKDINVIEDTKSIEQEQHIEEKVEKQVEKQNSAFGLKDVKANAERDINNRDIKQHEIHQ